eukprot:CAMPEP_0179053050 /NCGR_PEP_ID=MMETSP0796-20121207/22071_1 /TAXON_ID=73915 /ORGANISM="Pyrodinium bahamense, Strain pbaha01" /LENGTH=43 /DNA_ID= /DNA_START= /DNA_END= /DNA_ORIENTATION=
MRKTVVRQCIHAKARPDDKEGPPPQKPHIAGPVVPTVPFWKSM